MVDGVVARKALVFPKEVAGKKSGMMVPPVGVVYETEVHDAGRGGSGEREVESMEVKHEAEGRRCFALTTGLAPLRHEFLGLREEGEEQVLAKKKMGNWDSEQVVQGWLVYTNQCTMSLPAEKVEGFTKSSRRVVQYEGNNYAERSAGVSQELIQRVVCD